MSSRVAARIASLSLRSTVVAPRSACRRSSVGFAFTLRDSCSGARLLELRRPETPRSAWGEAPERNRADAHSLEGEHTVADGLEHPAHDPVASLVDPDLERRLTAGRLQEPDPGGRGSAVFELD